MMSDAVTVVVAYVTVVESLIIIAGNIFTIFVFWKHHNRLKRTYFLLINLAIADLLVGFTQLTMFGMVAVPEQIGVNVTNTVHTYISINIAIQTSFFFASLFFLVLISLERAYALIWPLRHRVASTKGYIYSVIVVWVAGMFAGTLALLAEYNIIDPVHQMVAICSIIVASLMTICASYLSIKTRLDYKTPATCTAHNRQNAQDQRATLSRTLFLVIAVSLVCFLPSTVGYLVHYLCSKCVPSSLVYVFNIFYFASSIINPIIYCFRMPIFRETLNQLKLCKQSKRYRVHNMPRGFVLHQESTGRESPRLFKLELTSNI